MKYKTGYWALSISIAVMMYSCNSGNAQENQIQAAATPTDFIQLKSGNADVSTGYPGSIEGQDNVDIKAQVTGYLDAVYVKEGQYVNKGQALFKINPSIYNEQVNNSDAALKAALASQATAKLEVDKLKPLVEGNVVSDMQLKTAQSNYHSASAQVAQARAALGSSKINADFTYIKAPVSGYIGRIPNRIGNLISPSDTSPLTTLSNISLVNVYFSMNEADFITYSKMSASENHTGNIELILADGSVYSYKGKLENASGNFDRTTGSIQMKAVFQNPDKLLRAGGTARVMIHKNVDAVLKVPKTAVKDIQDKFFVYKLNGKKVKMIPVEVSGGTPQDYFVSSGIKAGDKIAVNRIDVLTDGADVIPKITPAK
ncbi:efflux RND transporter periplasmic adaptor subunit [Chryseobacterium luteum]|uniref:RND transporter n=1 Tax=Chryseobacterium luteum TaxID=421531 RepID=A0A085YYB6_9FLAO|nr:efflux RND transporter periplasmic adaptor subunit [Chryseobacterium luteum]KFE97179.1 RND transporter [Chryseobacterium luteum]